MSKAPNPKYIFYYEHKANIGGLINLWIAILKGLNEIKLDFIFFNYREGKVYEILRENGLQEYIIDINLYDWSNIRQIVSENDILVITSFDYYLHKFFPANPKVLYYNLSQYVGQISGYKYGINFKTLGSKFIKKLDENNAYVAMDINTMEEVVREYGFNISNKHYIPVCVESNFQNKYIYSSKKILSIGYIGRSVIWKMMPLLKIIDDLYNLKINAEFHLIISSYEDACKFIHFDKYKNLFTFTIVENLPYKELDQYLEINRIDLGISMGTAALDFAKHHIPTLYIDQASTKFPDNYKYVWLHTSKEFCLGNNINYSYTPNDDGFTMAEIIRQIREDENFLIEKSILSYLHVKNLHSVSYTIKCLVKTASKTSFRLKDAISYVPYFWYFHKIIKKIVK